jgi:hypothetical protein
MCLPSIFSEILFIINGENKQITKTGNNHCLIEKPLAINKTYKIKVKKVTKMPVVEKQHRVETTAKKS